MEPLGTITIFYPYVDDETREILDSTMKDSSNFNDFVRRFCDIVVEQDTPMLTEYLATHFVLTLEELRFGVKLLEADKISPMAAPLLMLFQSVYEQKYSWDEITEALKVALSEAPNDWFVCHIYLTWSVYVVYLPIFPPSKFDLHPYDSVIDSIREKDEFEYFRSYLLLIDAFKLVNEYKMAQASVLGEEALQIAKKYDDQLLMTSIFLFIGQELKHSDVKRAIDYVLQARDLSEKHGFEEGLGLVQHILSHIHGIRGEYDAAIEHQKNYRDMLLSRSKRVGFVDAVIALYYNMSGDGESAYDYVKDFNFINTPARFSAHFQTQIVWSMYNLQRYNKARVELQRLHQLAIESGEDMFLMRYELLEALLDKAEGDFDNAKRTLEKIYGYYEKDPIPAFENHCLLHLVDIEIANLSIDSLDTKAELSGPWMKVLDEHVRRFDLPGIDAQSKFMKAKLRQKQCHTEEVTRLISEVSKASESPSMRYLKNLISKEFPEIVQ